MPEVQPGAGFSGLIHTLTMHSAAAQNLLLHRRRHRLHQGHRCQLPDGEGDQYLGNAVNDPIRPFTAILGGAKIADKLNVISSLLERSIPDYRRRRAPQNQTGGCRVARACAMTQLDICKEMMAKLQEKGVKLLLPVDAVCIKDFPDPIDAPVETTVVPVTAIPADMEGCDIGPETMKLFADAVKASKTVVWNGPVGVFENPTLAAGARLLPRLWLRATLPPSSAAATAQLCSRWVWATR